MTSPGNCLQFTGGVCSALSEKIVAVLPRIQCPHRIEPHQVQGLDLEHVFPVVQVSLVFSSASRSQPHFQWLVKASMEAREQSRAQMRSYAQQQFRKEVPGWGAQPPRLHLQEVDEQYRPQRRLKRKGPAPPDLESRLLITLQEYQPRGSAPKPEGLEEVPQARPLDEAEQAQAREHYQALCAELQDNEPQAQLQLQLRLARLALELQEEERLRKETRESLQQAMRAQGALEEEAQQIDRRSVTAKKEWTTPTFFVI